MDKFGTKFGKLNTFDSNSATEPSLTGTDPEFDAWLSQQLKFSEPHLDNDGFCERVMEQLPEPAPAPTSDRRIVRTQYVGAALASCIVAWQFPAGDVLSSVLQQSISLYSLVGVAVLTSLVATTGGIFAARRL